MKTKTGLGAVRIVQTQWSRSTEKRYAQIEKASTWASEKFRNYILGRPLIPLQHLDDLPPRSSDSEWPSMSQHVPGICLAPNPGLKSEVEAYLNSISIPATRATPPEYTQAQRDDVPRSENIVGRNGQAKTVRSNLTGKSKLH